VSLRKDVRHNLECDAEAEIEWIHCRAAQPDRNSKRGRAQRWERDNGCAHLSVPRTSGVSINDTLIRDRLLSRRNNTYVIRARAKRRAGQASGAFHANSRWSRVHERNPDKKKNKSFGEKKTMRLGSTRGLHNSPPQPNLSLSLA